MPRETESLQAIENRYVREIESKQKAVEELQREISQLASYVKNLQEMRAREEDRPLEAITSETATEEERPRGWIKSQVRKYALTIATANKRFGGGDVAKWIAKDSGQKLKNYQYNQIFMILKDMAKEGDLVRRVDGQYERIPQRSGSHSKSASR